MVNWENMRRWWLLLIDLVRSLWKVFSFVEFLIFDWGFLIFELGRRWGL